MTTKFNVETRNIPDGSYPGTVGGYECEFKVPGRGTVTVIMTTGIRGFNIPAQVSVISNVATVNVRGQEYKCKE